MPAQYRATTGGRPYSAPRNDRINNMKTNKNNNTYPNAKFEFLIIGIMEFFCFVYLLSWFFQQNIVLMAKGF